MRWSLRFFWSETESACATTEDASETEQVTARPATVSRVAGDALPDAVPDAVREDRPERLMSHICSIGTTGHFRWGEFVRFEMVWTCRPRQAATGRTRSRRAAPVGVDSGRGR